MQPLEGGYFSAHVDKIAVATRYRYCLDGQWERPDPASRFQPEGVHGPSEVVDRNFAWTEGWSGIPLEQYVLYELHVGTFTPQGLSTLSFRELVSYALSGSPRSNSCR
jgi:maltooligosyltrehalose trehalohydrolase